MFTKSFREYDIRILYQLKTPGQPLKASLEHIFQNSSKYVNMYNIKGVKIYTQSFLLHHNKLTYFVYIYTYVVSYNDFYCEIDAICIV